jgi:farnesyl-diphosphate farnesyltransferase
MFRLKYGGYVEKVRPEPLNILASKLNDRDFCYAVLNNVSRSFAVVIQQLPEELKDPVMIFYLVLRGLDSVEDDMTYENQFKIPLLNTFYQKLYEKNWKIDNVGDSADYRILLANFGKVINVFLALKPTYQTAIADITKRMGEGMAEFAVKIGSIDTCKNYDLYCHYVAGLVGHGLSALFSASGLESPTLKNELEISNSMGLFLQKTNIIRDYLEDVEQGRTWYPEEIWSQYGPSLESFKDKPNSIQTLNLLNHLVENALQHVPHCLDYLARLKNKKIFEFCAVIIVNSFDVYSCRC